VKHWTRALQKEQTLYRGAVASFSNDVAAGVPQAIGYLGALIADLEKYVELQTAGAGEESAAGVGAGAGQEGGGPSMARAADEAEKGPKGLDPEALRNGIPTAQAILAAKAGDAGAVHLGVGQVTAEQAGFTAKFVADGVPTDEQRIVISPGIVGAARLVLVRLEQLERSWFLGRVEGGDTGVYNTVTVGELRSGRPDLAELLRLPVGFMAVIGAGGIEAVFDSKNENVFKSE
jgi:hypothetical protein